MDIGYIKLYRKITNSFVWTNPNMLKLWLLCLMKANHKEHKFLFNGKEIHVSSGEFVTGRDAIAKEFNEGVPRDQQIVGRTLWRWLKKFENEEMLSIKSTTKYSVISIKNWHEYQVGDQQVSINRPSTVQQVSTNKNEKNDKNDKNKEIYSSVVAHLNATAGTNFKESSKATQRLIDSRIKEKFTEADFKSVIDKKVAEWKGNPNMEQYLRPNTLFSTKFESYLNQKNIKRIPWQQNAKTEVVPDWVEDTRKPKEETPLDLEQQRLINERIAGLKSSGKSMEANG
jgi:uncharacterized phage protein (TIGR02220 family)